MARLICENYIVILKKDFNLSLSTDVFFERVHLTYGIYSSLLCCTFTKGQTAPNVTGIGGETTLFTCPSPTITPGGSYILLKDTVSFYDGTSDGRIIDGKYNATAGNGEIKLLILNTNISDAGTYTCSHNFVDTSGYVSVAFRPENITTATTMLTNGWQLTATATKVFPSDSAISSVICLKPDNSNLQFGPVGQSVNPNSDIPYLFDISWNGTITEHLSGQVQCTITLVTIETIVRTIIVSFQDTSTSTKSTPNSTSGTSTTSSTTSATTISSTTTSTTTEPPLPSSTTSIPALISTTSTPIDVRISGSFLSTTTPSTTDSDQSRIIIISLSSSIGGIAMLILVCVVVCLLRNRKSTKSTGRVERVFYEDDWNNMVHQRRSNSLYSFEDSYSNSMQEWRYMNPNEYPNASSGRTYCSQQTNINDRHSVPWNGGWGTEAIRNPLFNGYISRR